jgi:hypothetical protein
MSAARETETLNTNNTVNTNKTQSGSDSPKILDLMSDTDSKDTTTTTETTKNRPMDYMKKAMEGTASTLSKNVSGTNTIAVIKCIHTFWSGPYD